MTKSDAEKVARRWLVDKDKHRVVFGCGSLGVLIATHEGTVYNEDWELCWADELILMSDLIHGGTKRKTKQTEGQHSCELCGRTFTKRFALTNHQKVCGQ